MSATQRELLEERWKTITRDVHQFKTERDISQVNSDRWYRSNGTLEQLAAMLVFEVNDRDVDTLQETTQRIWINIESELLAWAEGVEREREARKLVRA
jgi:hypothetical protein